VEPWCADCSKRTPLIELPVPAPFLPHTSLERGGEGGDLMELSGWSSPQMLTRYGASARASRARRAYDRIMDDSSWT